MNLPDEEPPPILATWRRIYTFVAVYLAAIILLFYVFERMFT